MLSLTAVTIPEMRSTFFVADFSRDSLPDSLDWSDWPIREGVRLATPDDLHDWPDDADGFEPPILCRSIADPDQFRVFKRLVDVPDTAFTPTGWAYGGGYSESHWRRFAERLPRTLEFYRIPDTDSSEAINEVLQSLRTRD